MNLELNANDRSIIGAICHFPDMETEEKQKLIKKIQDQNLIHIVEALAGLKNMNDLKVEERNTLVEIETWRDSKRTRIRNEQINARRTSNEPDAFARRLIAMRNRGQISEHHLFLYGISGDLPVRNTYAQMTLEERRQIWNARMTERYGTTWNNYFESIPSIFKENYKDSALDYEWIKEGF